VNREIEKMCKSSDIATEIKVRRLEWIGHAVIMEDTRLPKMVFNAKPEGRRGVGRPRLRWLDNVEADIKALGVKRWRIKAQDRKEWSAILREVIRLTKRAVKPEKKSACSSSQSFKNPVLSELDRCHWNEIKNVEFKIIWPCHGSGGYSPDSHSDGPGSRLG
jgi:hypothetical protein